MEESSFTAETTKMQKWTEVAFTNYLKNGLSGRLLVLSERITTSF